MALLERADQAQDPGPLVLRVACPEPQHGQVVVAAGLNVGAKGFTWDGGVATVRLPLDTLRRWLKKHRPDMGARDARRRAAKRQGGE